MPCPKKQTPQQLSKLASFISTGSLWGRTQKASAQNREKLIPFPLSALDNPPNCGRLLWAAPYAEPEAEMLEILTF